jgi:PAS domain S-box-containing protein
MSISKKIFLVILIFTVFGLALSTLVNIRTARNLLYDGASRQATSLLRSLQEKCKYAITVIDSKAGEAFVDRATLNGFVRDIHKHEDAVTEVVLADRAGMVFSALDQSADQPVTPEYAGLFQDMASDDLVVRSVPEALLLAGPIRVDGLVWGSAGLRFSLGAIQAEIRRLTIQALLMSGLFLVGGVLLSLPLVGTIVRPVRRLAEHAREVGDGRLDETPVVQGPDEIGQLGEAFAGMVGKLRRSMNDLERGMVELHNSEELLRQSERNYRELFENSVVGMFQCTTRGGFVRVNQAMAVMLGYPSSREMLEENVSAFRLLIDPKDKSLLIRNLRQEGRIMDFAARARTRDGRILFVTLSARTVRGGSDQPNLVEGSMMDITARRERDRAQRDREAARAANEMKSAFLANMSHEIRTPMNAVLGFTQMAMKAAETRTCRDYLQKIHTAATSLLGIINDILDFSRIEAGKLRIERVGFLLDEVLETALDCVGLRASEKGLRLALECDDHVPRTVMGDPMRIRQVLLNLVGNAVKFTDQGEVVLQVGVDQAGENPTSDDQAGKEQAGINRIWLRFTVRDTGIGLSREQISGLFSPFSQADASTARKYGGSGLGLTICKSLVEQMGGEIGVTSVPGQGSRFSFVLPFDPATEDQLAATADVPCGRPEMGDPGAQATEDGELGCQAPTLTREIPDIAGLLDELRISLRSDMKKALQLVGDLEDCLAGTRLADLARAVKRDVHDFETESALCRLESLAQAAKSGAAPGSAPGSASGAVQQMANSGFARNPGGKNANRPLR